MNLLLTLGHNSSAVLVSDNGYVLCGYENERLSKIKSDSHFPALAIEEIQKSYVIPSDVNIYVSHWFTDCKLPELPNKWWNPIYLLDKFPNHRLLSLNEDFTHHDAHAYSALAFLKMDEREENSHIIVADGFGNFGETFSIYKLDKGSIPRLLHRAWGFDSSLGLLYQYATSYLDLKENQDEYKLLGYEALITKILDDKALNKLNIIINKKAKKYFKRIVDLDINATYDPLCTIDALPATKEVIRNMLDDVLKKLDCLNTDINITRSIVAYFVQSIIQIVLTAIIDMYEIKNPILVGGLFMNVKLNNTIARYVSGKTSIMPLAGDQGAALGLYHFASNLNFKWPDNLFWGYRNLKNVKAKLDTYPDRFHIMPITEETYKFIANLLNADQIVNVVTNYMEFGARALGATSTLALPTKENVDYINKCNKRSTIMPMAGVVQEELVSLIHPDHDRIVKSMEYMICTRDFRHKALQTLFPGAAHYDAIRDRFTGRTQVVKKNFVLHSILNFLFTNIMINTSFNPHGRPILFSLDDIVYGHNFMLNSDDREIIHTFILTNERQVGE